MEIFEAERFQCVSGSVCLVEGAVEWFWHPPFVTFFKSQTV